MKAIWKILQYVVSPLIMIALCFVYLVSPVFNGYLAHPFPAHVKSVFIRRDSHSIPTIKGNTLKDSFFGQGYAHCQDRMWSMELSRRLSMGTLSELYGANYIAVDTLMREFGATSNVIFQRENLNENVIEQLQAYSDGVNLCLSNRRVRDVEQIAQMIPIINEWELEHSLAILNVLPIALSETNPIAKSFKVAKEKSPLVGSIADLGFLKSSSACWAVHGNLTVTGKPILVNELRAEEEGLLSPWYENHLLFEKNGKNVTVSGVSIPGVPGVIAGMTDYLAWGISGSTEGTDSEPLVKQEKDIEGEVVGLSQVQYELNVGKQKQIIQSKITKDSSLLSSSFKGQFSTARDKQNLIGIGLFDIYDAKSADEVEAILNKVNSSKIPLQIIVATNDNKILKSFKFANEKGDQNQIETTRQQGFLSDEIAARLITSKNQSGKITREQILDVIDQGRYIKQGMATTVAALVSYLRTIVKKEELTDQRIEGLVRSIQESFVGKDKGEIGSNIEKYFNGVSSTWKLLGSQVNENALDQFSVLLTKTVGDISNYFGGESHPEWSINNLVEYQETPNLSRLSYLARFSTSQPFPWYHCENGCKSTYKAVYSLDRSEKSVFNVNSGISESVLSTHYSDQANGEWIQIFRDLTRLREHNVDAMILMFDSQLHATKEEEALKKGSQIHVDRTSSGSKDQVQQEQQKVDM